MIVVSAIFFLQVSDCFLEHFNIVQELTECSIAPTAKQTPDFASIVIVVDFQLLRTLANLAYRFSRPQLPRLLYCDLVHPRGVFVVAASLANRFHSAWPA
jgi:hypothetical protein